MWLDFGSSVQQQACGFEYTSKLQRMFQDIGVSKDLNEQFKKHLLNSEPLDCKCSTHFRSVTIVNHQEFTMINVSRIQSALGTVRNMDSVRCFYGWLMNNALYKSFFIVNNA